MKTIRFKSIPENWRKEYLGLKRNTIRKKDREDDDRFSILNDYIIFDKIGMNIEIENTITHEVFSREVTDVTLWEGIYIISW